jgi:hypothetical protein
MKMKHEHYNYIRESFEKNAHWIPIIWESIANESKAKDHEKRLRWDMLYIAIGSRWICDNVYSYLDDSHIDSALRSIMRQFNCVDSCA